MNILDECHARGFIYKVFGGCNQAKRDVNKCLRAERLERSKANREKGRAMRERIEKAWKEVDEDE